jgi:hemerythrin-like metal-binding protein
MFLTAMFEWKNDYLIGVNAIDEQHKQIFRLAERFHAAVIANKGKAMLDEALDTLDRYTTGHFQVEERLMVADGYPELRQHLTQHHELRERLLDSQKRLEEGEVVTICLLQFMSRIAAHIASSDQELGEYHRARNQAEHPRTGEAATR